MNPSASNTEIISVHGVPLEVVQKGAGSPLLVLHGGGGPTTRLPYFDLLARNWRVIAPSHPGFAGSPLPDWLDNVDDLAYLYLDLLEKLDLRDVTVLGFSLGGWVAAEMAVRNTQRLARLILVAAVGIKVGDRETRDIPDIYAMNPAEVSRLIYHVREQSPDITRMTEEELITIAKNREAAALYLWEPYMHHPKLRRRLQRIDVPTLYIRGSHDGLVSGSYADAYCAAIPGARLEIIENAGHVPEREHPELFVEQVNRFKNKAQSLVA